MELSLSPVQQKYTRLNKACSTLGDIICVVIQCIILIVVINTEGHSDEMKNILRRAF